MPPIMIPPAVPPEVRADPKRSAEVAVFEQLSGDPRLNGFTIFYSFDWLGEHAGMLRDGEADFLAAHPQLGFISLEVKGGLVERRGSDRSWVSTDRHGAPHDIDNPIAQARKSKHVILQTILKRWKGSPPFIWARHGVILPHSSRPRAGGDLGIDMPLEIFAFREDMPNLGARVLQMLAWQPDGVSKPPGQMGEQGIEILKGMWGRDVSFAPSLRSYVEDAERNIELTRNQQMVLQMMAGVRRAVFQGGAGTGKTMLAVDKARSLAASGKTVLLLCFNQPLRRYLQSELDGVAGVTVTNFHQLCFEVAKACGLDPHERRKGLTEGEYVEGLPAMLEEAVVGDQAARYDAILVDEGQDFQAGWIDTLRLLLASDRDSTFYVFCDDNQNLYSGGKLAEVLGVQAMYLFENLRNTKPIFGVSAPFYRGDHLKCGGPDGPEVGWLESAEQNRLRAVEKQLNILINSEGFRPEHIAVITGSAVDRSTFAGLAAIGGHKVTDAGAPAPGHVTLDSVYRFKGLERPVVLVTDMEGGTADPELPYVALTRAKALLVVIGGAQTLRELGRR